jgi:hypothetical protein
MWLNRWHIATIILIIAYLVGVYLALPLASLSVTETLPFHQDYNMGGNFIVNETVTDSSGGDVFIVGDIGVFYFNVTNIVNQPTTFDFDSSVRYNQYGYPQTFTLNFSQSESITEEFPLNSEGSNGFIFYFVQHLGGGSSNNFNLTNSLMAISISENISLIAQKSTFILTMIIGIPAIVYMVKEFRELGKKKEEKS